MFSYCSQKIPHFKFCHFACFCFSLVCLLQLRAYTPAFGRFFATLATMDRKESSSAGVLQYLQCFVTSCHIFNFWLGSQIVAGPQFASASSWTGHWWDFGWCRTLLEVFFPNWNCAYRPSWRPMAWCILASLSPADFIRITYHIYTHLNRPPRQTCCQSCAIWLVANILPPQGDGPQPQSRKVLELNDSFVWFQIVSKRSFDCFRMIPRTPFSRT